MVNGDEINLRGDKYLALAPLYPNAPAGIFLTKRQGFGKLIGIEIIQTGVEKDNPKISVVLQKRAQDIGFIPRAFFL